MGRIGFKEEQFAEIYWPGTSVTINFIGSEVKAILKNGRENTYFYCIVDGDDSNPKRIKADTLKSSILLASGLKPQKHTLQLFKLSNNTSVTQFYGFECNEGATLLKANKPLKRKIEFYGNSITAGHGIDVAEGQKDSGAPEFFNNYWTYAARTAHHFNAQYSCVSRSGIGIMVSWFQIIMPEMFDRVNPADETSKWDFSKYTPDVVVINLCQNDMWIMNDTSHVQFKFRFGTKKPEPGEIIQSYKNFVSIIRGKYPNASIICALGSMNATEDGSPWPGYVSKAVQELADPKVFTLFFPYKNTSGHPKAAEQLVMANQLIGFIEKNIQW